MTNEQNPPEKGAAEKLATSAESITLTSTKTVGALTVTEDDYCEPVFKYDKPIKTSILVSATGIGMFMAALDESIITVSLPVMSESFGVDQLRSQWVVLIYLLTIVGFTAVAGGLGDRFGPKRVFQIGMIIFSIGSLACYFSVFLSLEWLVVFRFIQAIGATGTLANGMAIVTRFTSQEKRGLAIGLTSLVAALGVVFGPVIGSILTQFAGWEYIFFINIPIGIIGLIYVQYAIPNTEPLKEQSMAKVDVLGSFLFAIFMITTILGITLVVDPVIPRPKLISGICFGIAAVSLIIFIFWELRVEHPFMDLQLFKNRKFTTGVISATFAYIALNSVAFQLPFFFEVIKGFEPIQIGLVVVGVPVGLAVTAPIAGKLSNKIDARYLTSIGLALVSVSLLCLTLLLSDTLPLWVFILIATAIGLSIGIFTSPNANSVLSSAPKRELGVVSGLLSLSRNIGYTIGTSLSTTIFVFVQGLYVNRNGGSPTDVINYVPAMRIMFGVVTSLMAIAILLSFLRGSEERDDTGALVGVEECDIPLQEA